MDVLPLAVSPSAKLLLQLAERRASGSLTLGGRTLFVVDGELCDVTPGADDPDLGAFLVASGRLTDDEVALARNAARLDSLPGGSVEEALVARTALTKHDLHTHKRSLWLDRWVRALRLSAQQHEPLPDLGALTPAANSGSHPLLPFVLDSLARLAFDSDASVVGMNINHRLTWLESPLREPAQRWAAFGETSERPVISSVLARVPAVAPQIAALARAGLVRLDPPGTPGARAKSRTGTLPPPPPRLSVIPDTPVRPPQASVRPPAPAARAPRLRLDPGADGIPIEAIPAVSLARAEAEPIVLDDPLREIELRIAALEAKNAPGAERARAFVELSRLWHTRIGSLEEAARALREAVAADPQDTRLLVDAALHCSYLGRTDLGIAYAQTAIAATPISVERAAGLRLLSDIYRAADDVDGCIDSLSEAAAEDASNPEPHELLAHLLAERDNLPLAVSHARFAALGWAEHDTRRAAMLYAMAYGWNPSDPLLSEEYAALLYTLGHVEAAVAVVAETARNVDDPELRRRVRLGAAQRAEGGGRRDLSAELLLELFDDEPSFFLVYAPLDAYLNEHAGIAEHAAVLESIAIACPPDQRAHWLTRAGEVSLQDARARPSALKFFARAQRANPESAQLRTALQGAGISSEELAEGGRYDATYAGELELRLASAATEGEEYGLLATLIDVRAANEDARGVASAALRLLALDGKHAFAAARLWRATLTLRDPALIREALTVRARAKDNPQQRGRALAALCRQLENMNELDDAVGSADAALAADPNAADAAIVVLRHAHRLEPGRATQLLGRARALLGDSPPLLFALAQAALAARDADTHLRVLHDFCELAPLMPEPRLLSLAHRMTQSDATAIMDDAEALLRDGGGPVVVARSREAADRLAELGAYEEAARLAQRTLDERGQLDPEYAARALELARHAADPSLITVALERCASAESGCERLARLLELAAHHAALGDHVAELRALLRAVALDPGSEQALSGLADLFGRARDHHRLLTVLTLELDMLEDPKARQAKLLELAAAAADGGERDRAVEYIGALMIENAADRAALLIALGALFSLGDPRWAIEQAKTLAARVEGDNRGAIYLWIARKAEVDIADPALALTLAIEGASLCPSVGELLLMVERMTLATHDASSAIGLYETLIEAAIGPHGQRALHYRAGRWLERAGAPKDALRHYLRAFELARGAGVAYKAIERVTRATGQLSTLLDAQEELAETFRDADARLALLQDAARIALNELDDPARGFRLLMKADELADIGKLGTALVDAAHRIGSRDRGAEAQALGSIASTWEERANKYWDADTKAKLLIDAARVHLRERGDAPASLRALDAALTTEVVANLSQDAHAATLCAYAETLETIGRTSDALAAVTQALVVAPENTQALVLRARLPAPSEPPVETVAPVTAPAVPPTETSAPVEPPPPEPVERVPKQAGETQLRTRAEAGEVEALSELSAIAGADPTRSAEAHYLLGRLVRAEPFRVEALRQLHSDSLLLGAFAEATVSAEILSLFDPSFVPQRHGAFHAGLLRGEELHRLIDAATPPEVRRLLALLWENARAVPRFRKTIEAYELGPRQRASLATNVPSVVAFAQAARLLQCRDTPLYLKPRAQPALTVVPTHPPSIIARADLTAAPALLYRMAQSLIWADAEHALVCALPEQDGRDLLEGMLGAFGPKEASATLSRTGKELASTLWHTVPMRMQAQMRDTIDAHYAAFDYDQLRRASILASHRAATFVIGDTRVALETVASLETAPSIETVQTEDGFREACARSEAFLEVLRTALSETYLSLTAQVL